MIGRTIGVRASPAPSGTLQIATASEPWKADALGATIHPARSKWRSALNETERTAVEAHLCPQAMAFLDSLILQSPAKAQRHVA